MSNMTTVRSTIRSVRASPKKGAANALALVGYIECEKNFAGEKVAKPHSPDELVGKGMIGLDGFQQNAEKLIRQLNDAEIGANGKYQNRGGKYPPLKDENGKGVKDENGKIVLDKSVGRIAQPPELLKHLDLTIPHGASQKDAMEMANSLAEFIAKKHKVAVIFAVHSKDGQPNDCHFLISKRTVSNDGKIGKTARTLTDKPKNKNSLTPVNEIRQLWADLAREKTGAEWSIRSYKDRKIDLIPEPKLSNRKRAIGRKRGADPLNEIKKTRANNRYAHIKMDISMEDYPMDIGLDLEEPAKKQDLKKPEVRQQPAPQVKKPGFFSRIASHFAEKKAAEEAEKQRILAQKAAEEAAKVEALKQAEEAQKRRTEDIKRAFENKAVREEQERQKRIAAFEAKKAADAERAKNRPKPPANAKIAPRGRKTGGRGIGD